jgi:2-polyprenyl-6-methoxyphenol hydroxylase-like FAD-dependent oxidoreductase
MSSETFKIIIAGGSVAGLTLANMLEQNNIEYIVLEKYGSIAPQLGASIAVMPNGARILDQLGAWDPLVSSLTEEEIFQHLSMRDADGSELFNGLDFQATIRERCVSLSTVQPVDETRPRTDSRM